MTNACPKPGTGFPTSYVVIFFVFSEWRWEMIVRFVNIWWNCWPSMEVQFLWKEHLLVMLDVSMTQHCYTPLRQDVNEYLGENTTVLYCMEKSCSSTKWTIVCHCLNFLFIKGWWWRQTHDDDNECIVMKTIHMVAWTLRCDSTGGILLAIRKRENNVIRL
jgi:hypothetical protein